MCSTLVDGPAGPVIGVLEDAALRLARLPVPTPDTALEEAERLLRVGDLVRLAAERAVAVVDQTGAVRAAGHASTAAWLRTGGRMNAHSASGIRRNARQFRRLTATSDAVAAGVISHPMASAIATACAVLTDDDEAKVAERTLLNLARDRHATVEKVARAGRYLRQVLDPDGHLGDEERAWRNRYMSAHLEPDGSMTGSYRLPPEAAARLQALFDKYARNRATDDTRSQTQRNADILIQLLVQAVTAELLVVVNAEALPDSAFDATTPHTGADETHGDGADETHGDGADPAGAAGAKDDPAGTADGDNRRRAHDAADADDAGHTDGAQADDTGQPDTMRQDDGTDGYVRGQRRTHDVPRQRSGPDAGLSGTDLSGIDLGGTRPRGTGTGGPRTGGPRTGGPGTGGPGTGGPGTGGMDLDTDDRCPTCWRTTNRDIPGLLLPTGHPLPAPHIRRLARTSPLYRMVIDASGKPLDLGSAARLVPPWMRRAVLATYDTCAYDDCPIPARWTEMDHIQPWAIHHETKLHDIAPGCDYHNRDRARHPHKYATRQRPNGTWHITSGARRRTSPAGAMRC